LVLKKKRTHPKHVLFIDASQHYEKVKTQNVLRTEDIDKIISTYENRLVEEKYSKNIAIHGADAMCTDAIGTDETRNETRRDAMHGVSTATVIATATTIADNDYNLNIPRYVDTFEEEDAIDLKAITIELRELAALENTTDATIEEFCTELGIETPF
jgi:type I restriction enzyme M protein